MIKDCKTAQDWEQLLAESHEKPTFLLKHSTRCGISAAAWRAFQECSGTGECGFWRVLVIEDDPLIRANLEELLDAEGFDVEVAADGRSGVAAALARPPDVIVCDIMLPVLDGHGVLEVVRDHVDTAVVPFIFLTARAEREDDPVAAGLQAVEQPFLGFRQHPLQRGKQRYLDVEVRQFAGANRRETRIVIGAGPGVVPDVVRQRPDGLEQAAATAQLTGALQGDETRARLEQLRRQRV